MTHTPKALAPTPGRAFLPEGRLHIDGAWTGTGQRSDAAAIKGGVMAVTVSEENA